MWWLLPLAALAQDPAATTIDVGAYVETFYSWNFARPENGITNLRGFDNRHDTFSLSNVAVEVAGRTGDLDGSVVLQAGLAPNTYTLAEPTLPAVGGVGASDAPTWRNVQQAWGGWDATDALRLEAGLFLSPVGPESMAARDDWNFSRSNLFYGLPFYHSGVRLAWTPSDAVKVTGMVCNGWNSVVDNNLGKSPSLQVLVTRGPLTAAVMYLGGPERTTGAPEGQPWRHLGDLWLQLDATERLSLLGQGDVGFEDNLVGSNTWAAAALAARVRPVDPLFLSVRGDWFTETAKDGSAAIFWPLGDDEVGRIASATLTADWRPVDGLSLRLEGRHDAADDPMFFDDDVREVGGSPIADDATQDTVTAALVAWF